MSKKSLIWKIPCIVWGVVMGIVLLLLITVTVIMVTPKPARLSCRNAWRSSMIGPTGMWIWDDSICRRSIIPR